MGGGGSESGAALGPPLPRSPGRRPPGAPPASRRWAGAREGGRDRRRRGAPPPRPRTPRSGASQGTQRTGGGALQVARPSRSEGALQTVGGRKSLPSASLSGSSRGGPPLRSALPPTLAAPARTHRTHGAGQTTGPFWAMAGPSGARGAGLGGGNGVGVGFGSRHPLCPLPPPVREIQEKGVKRRAGRGGGRHEERMEQCPGPSQTWCEAVCGRVEHGDGGYLCPT